MPPHTTCTTHTILCTARSPLPLLTFDEYVGLARLYNATLASTPNLKATLRSSIYSALLTDFAIRPMGNVLGAGPLLLAPRTPQVLAFADYMARTHAFFKDVFVGVVDADDVGVEGWGCISMSGVCARLVRLVQAWDWSAGFNTLVCVVCFVYWQCVYEVPAQFRGQFGIVCIELHCQCVCSASVIQGSA